MPVDYGGSVFPGSISSLVLLSGSTSLNGIVLMEPASLACFGFARRFDPLASHILK